MSSEHKNIVGLSSTEPKREPLSAEQLLAMDSHSRERALELASFIVEAPAGAGKTELLTQRFLRLLTTVESPEQIVAITFTNKAAAEMRARILDSLTMAARGEYPAAPHKQLTFRLGEAALQHGHAREWQLLQHPGRLRIFTIDSLSGHLARQMPLLSRFGSQPSITEDAETHYRVAAERTLAMVDDELMGLPVQLALGYVDNDVQKLTGLLVSMLGKRDQWLSYTAQDTSSPQDTGPEHVDAPRAAELALQHLVTRDITAAAEVLSARYQQALMPIARFAASNLPCEHAQALLLDWDSPLPATAKALPAWLALCELVLTSSGTIRKTVNKNNGFPAIPEAKPYKEQHAEVMDALAATSGAEAALQRLRSLPYRQDPQSWQMVAALAQLLKLAVAQLWLVFQQAREVDFVEVSQRALQALGRDEDSPSDLALKLDYEIRHLLVDEFQDTSPGQVKLLQQLTAGWEPGDGRTLFTVGDPMQSIYRFRKANVGLFLEVAAEGIGALKLERLQLCRNNRSYPPVVDWINRSFAKVFPAADSVVQGAIHYREFIATRPQHEHAGVSVHPVVGTALESVESLREREAKQIVEIVRQTWAQDAQASIAVLVRARSHLEPLVAEIRRHHADLRFQAVEIERLAGRQSVQDLLALTHALLQRADRVNWLAILRAPWCGLSLADMHVLAGRERHRSIWALLNDAGIQAAMSDDGKQRCDHVVSVLAEILGQQGRQPLARWLESAWLMLGGAECLWQAGDIADVEAYFKLVSQLEQQGKFSLERLLQEVDKLYAAPDSRANGLLQFMTIHKSKGLEFDCVILPALERRAAGNETSLLLWEEVALETAHGVSTELVVAPFIPKGAAQAGEPSPYSYLRLLEKERADHESARVLYVAATRSVRELHLLASVMPNSKGELKPASGSFLELLWPQLGGQFIEAQAENLAEHNPLGSAAGATGKIQGSLADFIPQLLRVQVPGLPAVIQAARHESITSGQAHDDIPVLGRAASLEAHVGTLAHKYVEMIAARPDFDDWLARLPGLFAVMQRWFKQQGHVDAAAQSGAEQVQRLVQLTLQSADGRWVLSQRAQAAAELAMGCEQEGSLRQLVVDRCFIDNGERWIIDYKSTRLAQDVDTGQLLQAAEKFEPQLAAYAELFAAEGLPLRKAIYFMDIGKLCELP